MELGSGPSAAAAAAVINPAAGPSPAPVCRGDRLALAGLPGAGRAFRCVNVGLGQEPWRVVGAPALQHSEAILEAGLGHWEG